MKTPQEQTAEPGNIWGTLESKTFRSKTLKQLNEADAGGINPDLIALTQT